MAHADQTHWDERYAATTAGAEPAIPAHFAEFAETLVEGSSALEIACGAGRFAIWLAEHGLDVVGYDISPVAVQQATELAADRGVGDRCTFEVADLDDGLPAGQSVDLVVCNMFRDSRLDAAMVERLRPGGLVAVAALSEVGAEPGRFRVRALELTDAFADLTLLGSGEAAGLAWFVGRSEG